MMGMFNGHGLITADFVHLLRGFVTRLFDEGHVVKITAAGPAITRDTIRELVEGAHVVDVFDGERFIFCRKLQDGLALKQFGMMNFALGLEQFPDYRRWLLPGALL
jgi:hypothetical protein